MKKYLHLESFEAAAKFLGYDPTIKPVVTGLPEKHAQNVISGYELDVISEAAWKGEDKEIDWTDWNQRKYYAWWDMSASSPSGLACSVYLFGDTTAHVGSRRVFPTLEILKYVVKQHFEKYKDILVIPK